MLAVLVLNFFLEAADGLPIPCPQVHDHFRVCVFYDEQS